VVGTLPDAPTPQSDNQEEGQAALSEAERDASPRGSTLDKMRDLPTHWLLGSAVSRDKELNPLTIEHCII
jgi:hypothetical protein